MDNTPDTSFPLPKAPPTPSMAPIPGVINIPPTPPKPVTSHLVSNAQKSKNASWGAIISILIILGMVVMGAFYAWGQRIAEDPTHVSK